MDEVKDSNKIHVMSASYNLETRGNNGFLLPSDNLYIGLKSVLAQRLEELLIGVLLDFSI